jgi:tetratricopeptide (TPR) repeat protein
MREVHEAMRLNPANTLAYFREGVGFLYEGRYADALNVFRQTPNGFQPPLVALQLADALFHLGRKDEARETVDAYLETVRWLEQTAADGYPCYPVFAQDSALDAIRPDDAFQQFLRNQQTRWQALKKLGP